MVKFPGRWGKGENGVKQAFLAELQQWGGSWWVWAGKNSEKLWRVSVTIMGKIRNFLKPYGRSRGVGWAVWGSRCANFGVFAIRVWGKVAPAGGGTGKGRTRRKILGGNGQAGEELWGRENSLSGRTYLAARVETLAFSGTLVGLGVSGPSRMS